MTDVSTPVPVGTNLGPVIGGRLTQQSLNVDSTGAEALGLVTDAPGPLTLLGRVKAIVTQLVASLGDGTDNAAATSIGGRLKALLGLVGDLSDTPPANSLAGRLKAQSAAIAALGTDTYVLADGTVTLAAGGVTPSQIIRVGGGYVFDVGFTGTSPSLVLERKGAVGNTWYSFDTRTVPGPGDILNIPSGSEVRARNAGSGQLTNVGVRIG